MAIAKARINVSLSDSAKEALTHLARRDRIPAATKAARLLELALELEEDHAFDVLAWQRDGKRARYVSHAKAWKQ